MQDQEEKGSKKAEELFWRKCPICAAQFEGLIAWAKHIEEHLRRQSQMVKIEIGDKDYLEKRLMLEFLPFTEGAELPGRQGRSRSARRGSKRKLAAEAQGLLPVVANWLKQSLTTFSEINAIRTSDLQVTDQLVDCAKRLPDIYREQRDYLLKHEDRLRETGMDPKWPRKPGSQIRFVSESMAGAEWDLSPSSSREFVRQQKPRKGTVSAVDQRWWEPGSKQANEDA